MALKPVRILVPAVSLALSGRACVGVRRRRLLWSLLAVGSCLCLWSDTENAVFAFALCGALWLPARIDQGTA